MNDTFTIKHDSVESYVRLLCVSYSDIRRSYLRNAPDINRTLDAGDVTSAIKQMVRVYKLPSGLVRRVGYSARIQYPAAMHIEFTVDLSCITSCTLLFRESQKSLLSLSRYELLHIVGHELAHARMYHDKHQFHQSEFATDILALLVTGDSRGYRKNMVRDFIHMQSGYLRQDLLPELFRCLDMYAERIYLK